MFGYIRPVRGELLVKEATFYDAMYCGLCRYSGKHLSHFSRFLLNYDFTFLAALRLSLSGEPVQVEQKRCPYKIRRKATVCCDPVFSYTASAFGLFSYYKLEDDLRDQTGIARFGKRLLLPFFQRIRKKCDEFPLMEQQIREPIAELHALEQERCTSPDRAADCFGRILRDLAAEGFSGASYEIARQCGYHIGRFIYLIDAYDDLREDAKSGNYNPFLLQYGSLEQALAHQDEIQQTLTDSMNVFSHSYALACKPTLTGLDRILFNICELGGQEAIHRVELQYTELHTADEKLTKGTIPHD